MELEKGQKIAAEVVKRIYPYCQRIEVAESTLEELEKLKSAHEIRLVKMLGESGAGGH